MKTTLTIEIEYDSRKTDPDGLARAMDRLLETALSTPGIMDEYGRLSFGEFFVATETAATKIVLNISGGVLQDVFGSDPAITVLLCDFDCEGLQSVRQWHCRDSRRARRHTTGKRGRIPRLARWKNLRARKPKRPSRRPGSGKP